MNASRAASWYPCSRGATPRNTHSSADASSALLIPLVISTASRCRPAFDVQFGQAQRGEHRRRVDVLNRRDGGIEVTGLLVKLNEGDGGAVCRQRRCHPACVLDGRGGPGEVLPGVRVGERVRLRERPCEALPCPLAPAELELERTFESSREGAYLRVLARYARQLVRPRGAGDDGLIKLLLGDGARTGPVSGPPASPARLQREDAARPLVDAAGLRAPPRGSRRARPVPGMERGRVTRPVADRLTLTPRTPAEYPMPFGVMRMRTLASGSLSCGNEIPLKHPSSVLVAGRHRRV